MLCTDDATGLRGSFLNLARRTLSSGAVLLAHAYSGRERHPHRREEDRDYKKNPYYLFQNFTSFVQTNPLKEEFKPFSSR
jgi:hypothetical protein